MVALWVETLAVSYGYENAAAMLKEDMGAACDVEGYKRFLYTNIYAGQYLASLENTLVPTMDEIEAYYAENEEELVSQGLVKDGSTYRLAKANDSNVIYVMETGKVTITGLNDAKDYYLYEIKAPAGYNMKEEPVHFKITADYSADGSETQTGFPIVKVDTADNSTTLSTDVVNQAGVQLPTTGGMGTTIFYILGGLLVAAAVVLLVTRKRMNMEK